MKADPRTLKEFGESLPELLLDRFGRMTSRVQEESPLPADIMESDEEYRVVLDAPGATAGDVDVQVVEDTLEVRIDRFRPFNEGFEMVLPGRGLELDASVPLPSERLRADEATATLTDRGTLVVQIPKPTAEPVEDSTAA